MTIDELPDLIYASLTNFEIEQFVSTGTNTLSSIGGGHRNFLVVVLPFHEYISAMITD